MKLIKYLICFMSYLTNDRLNMITRLKLIGMFFSLKTVALVLLVQFLRKKNDSSSSFQMLDIARSDWRKD